MISNYEQDENSYLLYAFQKLLLQLTRQKVIRSSEPCHGPVIIWFGRFTRQADGRFARRLSWETCLSSSFTRISQEISPDKNLSAWYPSCFWWVFCFVAHDDISYDKKIQYRHSSSHSHRKSMPYSPFWHKSLLFL